MLSRLAIPQQPLDRVEPIGGTPRAAGYFDEACEQNANRTECCVPILTEIEFNGLSGRCAKCARDD